MSIRISFRIICLTAVICNATLAQWHQTNGPGNALVTSCAVSGKQIGQGVTLFVGTWGGGIFRSANLGANWIYANGGPSTAFIYSMAARGNYVFAGTYHEGVFRSSDEGVTWSSANTGLGPYDIMGFAFDGVNMFVSTQNGGGVFRSTDNGDSWIAANNGLPQTSFFGAAAGGGHVFVGSSYGVYCSSDGGTSWSGSSGPGSAFAVLVVGTKVFAGTHAGIYRSTDYGESWTNSNNGMPDSNHNVRLLASSGTRIFAGTQRGMYSSTDLGENWSPLGGDMSGLSVGGLVAYSDSSTTGARNLLAGTNSGVYLSSDSGSTWHQSNVGLIATSVQTLTASSPEAGNEFLFAGTAGNGVFLSTDLGISWIPINIGITSSYIEALAASPRGASEARVFAGTLGGVFRYDYGTRIWIPMNSGLTDHNIWTLVYDGENLFAGTAGGVFFSSDHGSNWIRRSNGLVTSSITTMAMGATYVYAANDGTFFRSTNNGVAWSWVGGFRTWSITSMKTVPRDGGGATSDLLASTSGHGVFRSADNGTIWTAMNDGLTDLNANSLFVRDDESDSTTLFVGTATGILRLANSGSNWTNVSEGYAEIAANSFTQSSGFLFVAGPRGVWRRPISELTGVSHPQASIPARFQLEQNYPNPFNPTTTIKFQIPNHKPQTLVTLKVFDLLGREVATLVNEEMTPGGYERVFDSARLTSGVYLYQLRAGNFAQTRKLILLR